MKVKIFTNTGDAIQLELELNKWLEMHKTIDIKDIKQSYACCDNLMYSLMSIWYLEAP